MRITTYVSFDMEAFFDEGKFVYERNEGYETDACVQQCKKGRSANQNNTQFQQGQAQGYANNANNYNSIVQQLLGEEVGDTAPGGMSPAAAAMYSSDLNNIRNTYNGLRQSAFSTAGERGFGNAPSGFMKSTQNALDLGEGQAQQAAYNNAQLSTEQQRQNAMATAGGMYGTSTSGEIGNTNAANTSAFNQSRMGSTLGDILSGASSVIGGISGFGSLFPSGGSNIMSQPQNVATQNLPTNIPGMNTFTTNNISGPNVGSY